MKNLIDVAMKREKGDLVIKNARIFNVFTGQIERGDIAVKGGMIAAVGNGYEGIEEIDAEGKVLLPGLIDSHIHIESSMLSPEAWAGLASPHGTTAIIADPHEIVNVCGVEGAEYMKEAFSRIKMDGVPPIDLYLELPSCVPATPFETSGACIDGAETARQLARGIFFGLGEMMNFPAVISADEEVLAKLQAAERCGVPIDGHAPGVLGEALSAYRAAGVITDHESLSTEECCEKVARGMYVQVRCGSSTNNLADAAKAVDDFNFRRFVLCSDDKNAKDLSAAGHIDDALRRLVAAGVPAKYAIPMATLNIAECYHLKGVGAVAPGYVADMVLVDDVENFKVRATVKRGKVVSREGRALFGSTSRYLPQAVRSTVFIKPVTAESFRILSHGGRMRAMQVVPHSLFTDEVFFTLPAGEAKLKGTEFLKLAVVERHHATGNIGLGFVKGYGLHGGAIGISVAHDSHNLVVLGDDDGAMSEVVALLERAGGGMALVDRDGEDVFPLDIAGLMSSRGVEEVISRTEALRERARRMGVTEGLEPFMNLAFLSLPAIPKIKLTDRGLFDLTKYSFVPLEEV